ncbi:hypothetical protein AC579_10157 [Pseudocercospora musae]|uniref:F-box domain-containing protein n=1 Tax=Pseudocercospora musae TaxID=113226 RepID=A0A139ISQ9_9PEZI|nr:hypothetical protein AC579_10157 [Pseudocercospora musae]
MGTNMSKDKQKAANMNLQDLPTEILETIAGKLNIVALGAFRTTSRAVQAKTTKAFAEAVVPDHTLSVRLTIPGVQAALTGLRFDDIAEQALHVHFRGGLDPNRRPKGPIDREELKRLLRKLFERLQSLQSVEMNYSSRGDFQGPSDVVAVLAEQPLLRLQTLKLHYLGIPVARLAELLNAHEKTLEHVLFADLCACEEPNDISSAALFAHMRDNMSLASVRIDHANDA